MAGSAADGVVGVVNGKIKGAIVSCPAYTHNHTHHLPVGLSIYLFVDAKDDEKIHHLKLLFENVSMHTQAHKNMTNPI